VEISDIGFCRYYRGCRRSVSSSDENCILSQIIRRFI